MQTIPATKSNVAIKIPAELATAPIAGRFPLHHRAPLRGEFCSTVVGHFLVRVDFSGPVEVHILEGVFASTEFASAVSRKRIGTHVDGAYRLILSVYADGTFI